MDFPIDLLEEVGDGLVLWVYLLHVDMLYGVYLNAGGAEWKEAALAGTEVRNGLLRMESAFNFGEGDTFSVFSFAVRLQMGRRLDI